jgi:hypothetical protein
MADPVEVKRGWVIKRCVNKKPRAYKRYDIYIYIYICIYIYRERERVCVCVWWREAGRNGPVIASRSLNAGGLATICQSTLSANNDIVEKAMRRGRIQAKFASPSGDEGGSVSSSLLSAWGGHPAHGAELGGLGGKRAGVV